LNFKRLRWFDDREGMAKGGIEDEIDPPPPDRSLVEMSTFVPSIDVTVASELGHQREDKCTLLW